MSGREAAFGWRGCTATVAGLLLAAAPGVSAKALELTPCRLKGVPQEALCGALPRPLDPAEPHGRSIDVHVAVLPAVARNKLPDPVVFFAGGPGQSAIDLAGVVSGLLGRIANRRDVVLIDQRGTGRTAALECEKPDPWGPLAQAADTGHAVERLHACARELRKLPHGDLRQYTTTVAMRDVDAVRDAIGALKVNLIGGSYGTRAALEYMRLFPQHVRSAVLDGVAPPDMGLSRSFSLDNQAALDAVFEACAADARCGGRYPALRARWESLLTSMPKPIVTRHPISGVEERFELSRGAVLGSVRRALYVPALTAGLPAAIDAAAYGNFGPLLAIGVGPLVGGLAEGMHFSVMCAEDVGFDKVSAHSVGKDFLEEFDRFYVDVCKAWPKTKVSEDFRDIEPAPAPTLVLSGGADPATPARHGARVAQRLGERATHLVIPHAAHGLMGYACVREVIHRFVEEADRQPPGRPALPCADRIPRATPFLAPAPLGLDRARTADRPNR